MESLKTVFEHIAAFVDWFGIAILIIGAVKFVIHYVGFEFDRLHGLECAVKIRRLRMELGSYILLSLEFMIISDIIHSAMTHTLDDFLLLGLLVVIRTAISFFLGRELKEIQDENAKG